MEITCSAYIPIPLALRRDPQAIRKIYNKGLQQKRDLVRALSKLEDGQYYQQLYTVTTSAAENPTTTSFPCSGVNLASIERSYLLSSERKETLMFGFKQVVREGLHNKYRLLSPDQFDWDNERFGNAEGVISSGVGTSTRTDWLVLLCNNVGKLHQKFLD